MSNTFEELLSGLGFRLDRELEADQANSRLGIIRDWFYSLSDEPRIAATVSQWKDGHCDLCVSALVESSTIRFIGSWRELPVAEKELPLAIRRAAAELP